jgi:tRNA(Ile)-lysidine synthase
VRDDQRLLLGVSGGADSVALLHLLLEASLSMKLDLEIGHFDHRLREDSATDRDFVIALAERHGIPVRIGVWESPSPSEDAARTARLAFLTRTAQDHHCDAIVLGHHLEDRIETLLLRLGRGSGLRGLAGLRWRRSGPVDLVRPLLGCQRHELREWLAERDIPWRDDPSNSDLRLTRNRLRHNLLPALDELGSGWRNRAEGSLDDLVEVWETLEAEARRIQSVLCCEDTLDRQEAQPLQGLQLRTVLQLWLEERGITNLRREHLEEAAGLLQNGQTGQKCVLPGAVSLVLGQKALTLHRQAAAEAPQEAPERLPKSREQRKLG